MASRLLVVAYRHLGNLDYGEPIGKEFRGSIEARFFGHYLKDEPGFDLAEDCQLSNRLQHLEVLRAVSARGLAAHRLHLAGDGLLNWAVSTDNSRTSYVSDPAKPVPYRHRPIQPTYSKGSQWYNWLTEDQRFVTDRIDVAVWKLPVLTKTSSHRRGGGRYLCRDHWLRQRHGRQAHRPIP